MASDAKKILLVEDEKAIRDAVAAYLEREGYWVVGVGDGQSAVEEFEKHQFDLIVLDLMLPKLSGERVCRAIRDTSDVPHHHADRQGRGRGPHHRSRAGRGRLPHQAVQPPRARRPRVRALFRRTHLADEPQVEVLDFGDLVIDISGHKILSRAARSISPPPSSSCSPRWRAIRVACTTAWSWWRRSWLRLRGLRAYHRQPRRRTLRAKLGDDPKKPKWLYTVARRGLPLRGSAAAQEGRGSR